MSVDSRSHPEPGPLLGWALSLLLALFAVAPLTYPGFFETDSGFVPAYRAAQPLDDLEWLPLPGPLHSEGRLPYLLAWPFLQLTGRGVAAIRWGYGLAFLLGAWGAYAWLRHWLGGRGAVLGAAVYTYLPWHLAAVYARGAYAEAWLWTFWPWFLWSIDRLGERRLRAAIGGIVLGLPLLLAAMGTLPGLAALSLPLILAYAVVIFSPRRRRAVHLALVLALQFILLRGAVLSGAEPPTALGQSFLYPFQILSIWLPPGPGAGDAAGLGLGTVGLSLVAVALWARGKRDEEEPAQSFAHLSAGRGMGFWLAALLVLVLLVLPLAEPLWRLSGLRNLVTYPWQLLALAGLPLAFLGGSAVTLDRRLASLPAWGGLLALVVLASLGYLAPEFTPVDPGREPLAAFRPVEARSAQILLLDTQVAPPGTITPTLVFTLTWQAVEPLTADYTTFVHILDTGGNKVAQRDSQPCSGACPTSGWQPGKIVVDRYEVALPPETLPGPYRLALGLYLLESGERLALAGRENNTVVLDVPQER